jgi:O-antigen/teichoic acid export membrane protein
MKLDPQYKTLAKNALLSIFLSYGTYIFTLLTSFLFARLISREEWAILILASSIIGIFSIIVSFLPPGLMFSMNFYLPRYRAKNNQLKLRSFMIRAFYMRILVIFVIFFIAISIISLFESYYTVFLNNHITLLYILAPLIIIQNLDGFFMTFLVGFNLFKTNFYFFLLKSASKIVPLIVAFVLFGTINIEAIALINLISLIIPVVLELLIFIKKIPKVKSKEVDGFSFKKFIMKVVGYGSFLRIENFMNSMWGEVQTVAIGTYESSKWVTGNNISKNFTNVTTSFLSSLSNPLIYSLSSLDYKENYDKIANMFKTIFNYSLFIFLFISGLLFFISDFFLSFIYLESYVEYALLIKIILISMGISIYPMLFGLLLRTTNRIKLLAIMTSIFFPLHIISVFIGLINYGIYGMYFAIIIINVILLICELILTLKLLKIRLGFYKMILQYISYLIAIFVPIILGTLILDDLSFQFWVNSNLPIFKHLNLPKVLIFVIIFLILNITFKTLTKSDLEYIEMLFTKNTFSNKYINKFLRFLKRFLR